MSSPTSACARRGAHRLALVRDTVHFDGQVRVLRRAKQVMRGC
jgi:hypothetical protein